MLYRFDSCLLDTDRRELHRGGAPVAVEPQVFDLLALLLAARDRVVDRDEMIAAVWRGRIVSEATLASRINAARVAIGDSGAAQRLIRTLPRRGLRFVGAVEAVAAPTAPPPSAEMAGPWLAVLPLANLGGDPAEDYFADGVTEEITIALSHCAGLFVIARNSAFAYRDREVDIREIGRELGVGYLLEGSLRRDGDRLRISCRLIDARNGAHLWADRFEGGPDEVFALQDRVAESVVAAIEPTLQSAEAERHRQHAPATLTAYDLLLRARAAESAFTAEGLAAALAALNQALALDPTYAPAMAAAAHCRALCHFQGWPASDAAINNVAALRLAWAAAEQAPNDAQVLWQAAFAIWNLAGEERGRARALFRRSLLLNPNSAMGLTLAGWIETMCGHVDEGRAMVLRAVRLNPRDPRGWLMDGVLALAAMIEGDDAGAAAWAERALARNRRFAVALRVLAVARVQLGETGRAAEAVRDLLRIEPGLTIGGFLARIPMPLEAMARRYEAALRVAGLPS
ncbi:MAG: winged helix-turn-helix domain-containing protein [Paracraurococcus sp.]